ncbi:BgTH12-07681 [Blumeria graminis f. sp. triticale]|uniref:BgtE-5929 n=3 Tax=Blumeria graminis TaxID=34373 RepID=A0A061HM64_BLUGR|nr:putative secreted effector protein [Blumeria graminis f. sp. tritici 96224]CAD6500505.1 BgTH12-07681 [Blumeria graminis f. sp. triticale]VCU40765.1 BgtE-5929 [Blumeria graminis f. sp. tritici]
MRLLRLASIIALHGHLVTVSSYNYYRCLSGVRFPKAKIHLLGTQIRNKADGHRIKYIDIEDGMPIYEFDTQVINNVRHLYLIKANLATEALWVMEEINEVRKYCNPT